MKTGKTEKRMGTETVTNHMLDILIKNSDRRLDAIQFQNAEYRQVDQEVSRCLKRLEQVELTRQQDRVVDELLSAYNAESSCCCKIFYKQGFKDCISLLREIGIIR